MNEVYIAPPCYYVNTVFAALKTEQEPGEKPDSVQALKVEILTKPYGILKIEERDDKLYVLLREETTDGLPISIILSEKSSVTIHDKIKDHAKKADKILTSLPNNLKYK